MALWDGSNHPTLQTLPSQGLHSERATFARLCSEEWKRSSRRFDYLTQSVIWFPRSPCYATSLTGTTASRPCVYVCLHTADSGCPDGQKLTSMSRLETRLYPWAASEPRIPGKVNPPLCGHVCPQGERKPYRDNKLTADTRQGATRTPRQHPHLYRCGFFAFQVRTFRQATCPTARPCVTSHDAQRLLWGDSDMATR